MATRINGNSLLPYDEVWAYSSLTLDLVLSVILRVVPVPPYFPKTGSESSNILREFRFMNPMTLHTT